MNFWYNLIHRQSRRTAKINLNIFNGDFGEGADYFLVGWMRGIRKVGRGIGGGGKWVFGWLTSW
jgi:hypothetical protein